MQINEEYLKAQIQSLRRQEAEHLALANMAAGAAQACEAMLERLRQPEAEKSSPVEPEIKVAG